MKEDMIKCLIVGPIQTNCWIYSKDDFCAVIDPGDEANKIIAFLKKNYLTPDCILLTHGHFDHLAALPDLNAEFLRAAVKPVIAIHADDSGYLGKSSLENHLASLRAAGGGDYIGSLWKPLPGVDRLLAEGDTLGPLKVLHVPGHTQGSVVFYDEEAAIMFSGDTLFYGDYGRTDLPGGDQKQLEQSLRRLFSMDKNIKVYPGHGSPTTIKNELQLL